MRVINLVVNIELLFYVFVRNYLSIAGVQEYIHGKIEAQLRNELNEDFRFKLRFS